MRGRRRRRRRRKGRRGASTERFIDARVERTPNSREKSVKVKIVRRRNGEVTEESFEL